MCYEPHPLCLMAADEVQRHIAQAAEWREEAEHGKMFGCSWQPHQTARWATWLPTQGS